MHSKVDPFGQCTMQCIKLTHVLSKGLWQLFPGYSLKFRQLRLYIVNLEFPFYWSLCFRSNRAIRNYRWLSCIIILKENFECFGRMPYCIDKKSNIIAQIFIQFYCLYIKVRKVFPCLCSTFKTNFIGVKDCSGVSRKTFCYCQIDIGN